MKRAFAVPRDPTKLIPLRHGTSACQGLPPIQQALEHGAAAAREAMQAKVRAWPSLVNGWQMPAETMGVYGSYHLKRAALAMVGLGSNVQSPR